MINLYLGTMAATPAYMVALWAISATLAAAGLVWLFAWLNNSHLKKTRYKLPLRGLEKDVKIVQLSDLHGKSFGRNNARLIALISGEAPDIIAITGDIVHKYRARDTEVALKLVSALSAVAPVFFVAGNHEMRNKGYRFFRKQLTEAGATVLDDETISVCGLNLAGLNCASLKNRTAFALKGRTDDNLPTVLLAHMPHFFDKYAGAGYDVVFSGHAHGGQWRVPFTDIGFYSPGQGFFPELTSGVHSKDRTRMVISRGLGNSQCPLRLFNRPEVVVAELSPFND